MQIRQIFWIILKKLILNLLQEIDLVKQVNLFSFL